MRRRVRHFLWTCWYRGWAVLAGMIILLALLFSAARLLLPLAPGYKQEIAAMAGGLIQRPVTIERISTDWKWFSPRLKLLGVGIEGRDGSAGLNIDQVALGIDLLDSLLEWTVDVDDITVIGTRVSIQRDGDGRWVVQDVAVADRWNNNGSSSFVVPPELQGRTIRLADGVIDYSDKVLDIDYRLHAVDAALKLEPEAAALYVDAGLPEQLGERIEFAVELDGPLSRPRSLNGRFYLGGKGLVLANWAGRLGVQDRVRDGRASLSVWLGLGETRRYEMLGRVEAENLLLNPPGGGDDDRLWGAERLAADARIRIDRETIAIDLERLQLVRHGRMWDEAGLSFRTPRERSERYRRGELAGDFLRFEDLYGWAALSDGLSAALEQSNISGVRGDLSHYHGRWDLTGAEPQVRFKTEFAGLGIRGRDATPSVSGLRGSLRVDGTTADVRLRSDALVFDYPTLFRGPLPEAVVDGRVRIRRRDNGWWFGTRDLWVDTAHAQSRHWIDLLLPDEGPPRIDAYGLATAGDASATPRYIPVGVTDDELLKWLDGAFVSGVALNGEYRLRGPLDRFPYRNGEGTFRVEFDTEGNSVNFWPPGPIAENVRAHVIFENAGMRAFAHHVEILDSTAQNVAFSIRDFEDSTIELSADLYGPLNDVVRYVQGSRLRALFDGVIDQVSAEGTHATAMRLTVPLGDAAPPVQYTLNGELHRAGVRLNDWGLTIDGVDTPLRVTDRVVESPAFDAALNTQPVRMRLDTQVESGRRVLNARVNGDLDAGGLLSGWEVSFADRVSGTSPWEAQFEYDLDAGDNGTKRLTVNSDLLGTGVDLPAPFDKPAQSRNRVKLTAAIRGDRIDTDFQWARWLYGVARLTPGNGAYEVERADIRANAGVPTPPSGSGIRLTGSVPELNIDHWRDVYRQFRGVPGILDRLETVNLQAERLTFLGRSAEDIHVALLQKPHNWDVQLTSRDVRGHALIPKQGFSKRGLAINMEYLDLDSIEARRTGEPPDPADVPPFQFAAGRLKLNNWDLREVRVLAEPGSSGLEIHSLRILDPSVQLEGSGRWLLDDDGEHQTRMHLNFKSENVGEGMARFGFAEMIKDANGEAAFDLHWPAAPWEFSLDILQGDAEIALDDGQILDLEPGGGRIFGLLSLQTIPRRLALDFTDLFGEGYRFDKMRGSFTLVDGNAFTSDYYIDGPVGRIDVRGRIGLAQRDYDQTVIFRPDLSSSLPLVGALLGGATGGWAIILADRVARLFGKQADDLGRVEYSLTGNWDDPQMTPIRGDAGSN